MCVIVDNTKWPGNTKSDVRNMLSDAQKGTWLTLGSQRRPVLLHSLFPARDSCPSAVFQLARSSSVGWVYPLSDIDPTKTYCTIFILKCVDDSK